MLNVAVPFEVNTVHSQKFNYPTIAEQSPSGSRRESLQIDRFEEQRSRRGSGFAAEDEHSHILAEPISDAPPVVVFFSFLNKQSRKWAVEHQVVQSIRRNVRKGTTVERYHVPTKEQWTFGEDLTHAWSAAMSLEIDDRIIVPLFDAVQSKRVVDLEGIRSIFSECNIAPEVLLKEWAKKNVVYQKERMWDAVAHIDLQEVPSIMVNGKYIVKLDSYDSDFDVNRAIDLVKTLLARE